MLSRWRERGKEWYRSSETDGSQSHIIALENKEASQLPLTTQHRAYSTHRVQEVDCQPEIRRGQQALIEFPNQADCHHPVPGLQVHVDLVNHALEQQGRAGQSTDVAPVGFGL